MIASMWMTRELVTIEATTPIVEAAALMAQKHIRHLPVVQQHADGMHLLGIVSSKDILHAFPSDTSPFAVTPPDARLFPTTAAHIMSQELESAVPETPIEDAARLMKEKKIGALPILHDHKLVGLITESDIFRAFVSIFDSSERGARITFDISKGEDIFAFINRVASRRKLRVLSLVSSVQHNVPVCVVRIASPHVDELLEDLWNSDHRVLNVLRFD